MTVDPNPGPDDLAGRLARVRAAVEEAADAAGRRAAELTLIAVTKFHGAPLLRDLAALGVADFGESRHQEAREKAAELADLDSTWHFIGQLQSKKARQVAEYASVIHSVDRASLADLLASDERQSTGESIGCFVQVNLTPDPERGGVSPEGAEALAEHLAPLPGLRLLGVMAVAPNEGDPRAAFARLRSISEAVRTSFPRASAISAGMSNDFAAAIAEGATHLRIGSAITGNRPDRR
ncbi:YggS family pyridoxal phosphate-dependent enzyme [Subtercola boreus]|uniref:Pyridoxal phosphate homeostasis protein n=1 Tax=Subtercola boreus TaxID=120213 RepID=A0A3E0WDV0_9MICO|nr:YggS family pyridoxal phosphate-dependent enzyme [Subtercola boreus]RFA21098.1 YggS family pyridoxal phosphate enzyme [Subtercola boreus]RFA21481.1 YggS family pyridoxal phosphate enzyme [Subtercola boreus]RFA27452.1 YggS family pyridoxal phosphate enzyme [Subtercola boreus]